MGLTNWFWNMFPKTTAECVGCDITFPKEAMKEICFAYTEENGKTGSSSVFVCEGCMKDVAENTERMMNDLEVYDADEPI
jgi:hypothetical protein